MVGAWLCLCAICEGQCPNGGNLRRCVWVDREMLRIKRITLAAVGNVVASVGFSAAVVAAVLYGVVHSNVFYGSRALIC